MECKTSSFLILYPRYEIETHIERDREKELKKSIKIYEVVVKIGKQGTIWLPSRFHP